MFYFARARTVNPSCLHECKTKLIHFVFKKRSEDDEQDRHIPEFTKKELSIVVDSLKKGNSSDIKGIKAEDPKGADTKKRRK